MYFHPLQEELGNMSDEALAKRIKELTKKKMSVLRFGRNPSIVSQISNALESYRAELGVRRIKNLQDTYKKSKNEPDLGELVNIE